MKRWILMVAGFGLVIFGSAQVLAQWQAVVVVFKGVIGAVLAVAGLVVLAMAKD